MSTSANIVIAFDLYGTLLSTVSVAKKLSELFGEEKGPKLAATWRQHQLEYTWRANSMGIYTSFSTITRRSLMHTLSEYSLPYTPTQLDTLLAAYDSLSTFPDVSSALDSLRNESNITPVVFSNGTHAMVSASVYKSPDLSPYQDIFKDLVTVEEVKRFKPDPGVYYHLAKKMGKGSHEEDMGQMWLVSGNPFDVVGARAVGMQAAWVDREGKGWTDGLVEGVAGGPTVIVKGLGEVIEAVRRHAKG